MKKVLSIIIVLLFVIIILLPCGMIISNCLGYTFELASYPASALTTALLSAAAVILSVIIKNSSPNKTVGVFCSLLAPLSIFNAIFFIIKSTSAVSIASMLICIVCCCYISLKQGKPQLLNAISVALAAVMVLPATALIFFNTIFSGMEFGKETVVETIESPNGIYRAEIVDNDQGALGGSTCVYVYKCRRYNLLIFELKDNPTLIYTGRWGESYSLEVSWKNNDALIINNRVYEIDK